MIRIASLTVIAWVLKYHKVTNVRRSVVIFALISASLSAQDSQEVMNQGIAAFKNSNYQRAVEFFQQAVTLDPNGVNPHLYLGTTYMTLWIPEAQTPENEVNGRSAETEFKRVLELDGNNEVALASIASLAYNSHKLDEARDWY